MTAEEWRVSARVGVRGPGSEQGAAETQADEGDQRTGLAEADNASVAAGSLMSSLTPSAEVNSSLPNPPPQPPQPPTSLLALVPPPYRLRLSVSTITLTSLAAPATCGWRPSDTGSNLATPDYV